MISMIEGYFDGCCGPRNPGGHAAWGAMVKLDGNVVWADGGYCGTGPKMSNNVAEYSAVCAVIRECLKHEGVCILRGDSKLVVMQLMGKWKVRGGLYVPFYQQAMSLWQHLKPRARLEWIPREQNDECDHLSKDVLRGMGITFRIQPEAA